MYIVHINGIDHHAEDLKETKKVIRQNVSSGVVSIESPEGTRVTSDRVFRMMLVSKILDVYVGSRHRYVGSIRRGV